MKFVQRLHIRFQVYFLIFFVFQNSIGFSQSSAKKDFVPRSEINLNGEWQVKEKGESNWKNITLPAHEKGKGVLLFKKAFDVPVKFRKSQFVLKLGGINFSFQIKLNDQYIATQNHGFVDLSVPIPSKLIRFQRSNQIEIEVDTKLTNSGIPIKNALFQPEFLRGIFREVALEILPPFFIDELQNMISISDNFSQASIASDIIFKVDPDFKQMIINTDSNRTNFNLNFSVYSNSGNPVYSTSNILSAEDLEHERNQVAFEIQNPKLWDIKLPNLYRIELTVGIDGKLIDRYSQNIGIRQFKLHNNQIILNNKEFNVRGVTFVEGKDNRITLKNLRTILGSIKSLGFNCISWFTPPPERVLAKMDSIGLVSILRIPAWNIPSGILSESVTIENGESILQKIIGMSRKHPSVIAISFGQGFDSNKQGSYDFIKHLRNKISSSESFFVTAGFRNYKNIQTNLPLDFISINLMGKFPERLSSWVKQWAVENPNLPILFSDVFVPFIPTQADTENTSVSQSVQALKLKKMITTIQDNPTLGFVLTSLQDYSGVYPTLSKPSEPQSKSFPFGIASEDQTPRMAWNMIQNLNSERQDQFLFQQEVKEENRDNLFLFFGLVIIALFLYSFRKDHKLRGNFIRILSRPFGFHMEIKEGRKISISSSLIVFLTLISCWSLVFASLFYYLRLNLLFDFILAQISPALQLNILLINMAWHPFGGFVGFIIIFSLLAIILAAYIKGLTLFAGASLSFRNAFTFITWEGTIFIFLLPIALVFHRLLAFSILHLPLLVLIIIFLSWYGYRLFIGMKTIFNFAHWLSFLFIVLIPICVWLILFIILDQNRAFFDHIEYSFNVWKSTF